MVVVLKSHNSPIKMKRNIRMFVKERRSLIRERFGATSVIGLAILMMIIGQTRKAMVKKSSEP